MAWFDIDLAGAVVLHYRFCKKCSYTGLRIPKSLNNLYEILISVSTSLHAVQCSADVSNSAFHAGNDVLVKY